MKSVDPYLCQIEENAGLLNDQKALIIGAAFRPQLTEIIDQELERLNVVHAMVPKT